MKIIFYFIFFTYPFVAIAQERTIKIGGFSDQFYASVFVANAERAYSDGWVAVYESGTDREMARSRARNLQIQVNLPLWHDSLGYDEQGVLIYEDLTFDGIRDLILYNGQNGPYGSWTYDFFLGFDSSYTNKGGVTQSLSQQAPGVITKDTSWFVFSPVFTNIIHSDGTLFNMDKNRKTVTFIAKKQLNAYRYLLSTYEVNNNVPRLIRREEYRTFLQ